VRSQLDLLMAVLVIVLHVYVGGCMCTLKILSNCIRPSLRLWPTLHVMLMYVEG
jgi:hypothetical protein